MKPSCLIPVAAALAASCSLFADNVNLALGKAYKFDTPPSYALCRDSGDVVQLTDGQMQKNPKGAFWTCKETVGWSVGSCGARTITLDLGKDEPLKGFAWNYAAGRAGVEWPDLIYIYTSVDGKKWRFVGDLLEASAEENGAPSKDGYSVQLASSVNMHCHGRYVAFLVQSHNYVFVDEIMAWQGPAANLADAEDGEVVESPLAHYSAVRASRALLRDADRIVTAARQLGVKDYAEAERRLHGVNAIIARSKGYVEPFFWPGERWANNSPLDLPTMKSMVASPVVMEMMRGETRSVAVNFTNPTDADVETMVEVKGFPDNARVELREVVYTIVKSGDRTAGLLLPNEAGASLKLKVPAGETKQLWISFAKPTAAAGTYAGRLVATGVEQPLTLRMADLDFPARPRMHVGGWDYSECGNTYYQSPSNLKAKMARMREIFTDSPWATPRVMPQGAKFDAAGKLLNAAALDFSAWKGWVELWGDDARQYCVFMSVKPNFQGEKMGTVRFNRMVGEYMRAWYDGVKAELKGRRIVVLLVDEPHEKSQDECVVAWARAVKAAAPEFVIFEDVDYKDPTKATKELYEVSEIICPPCPSMTAAHTEDFFAKFGREGKELWLYSCCGPSRQFDPIAYYRSQAWHAWKIGAKGSFFWALGCGGGIGDSFRPFSQTGVEYSPFFVSPTDAFRAKQSEAIMESVEDYEYLALLQEKIEKGKAAGKDVSALERLLFNAPRRALEEETWLRRNSYTFSNGVKRYDWNLPRNHALMDAVRLELLHALEAPLVAADPLPGEPATKPALSPVPFPDALSAYVWRNWFVVPKDRLAAVVRATPAEITALAVEMGLPPDPKVSDDWRRRGYITLVRRNWHLLPYDQLLALLDMTRAELKYSLIEEDFLFVKLGNIKPKCEPLYYSASTPELAAARRRIARYLKEEGVDAAASEEPRFTFVNELKNPDPSIKVATDSADPRFDLRLIFSYFADYGDPLWDEDISSYPEGLIQRLAAQGVNAVWLHTVLRTLAKDPKYPEFGEGCERRLANLRKLVKRAAKYGVKVYLYMNEPRAHTVDFFEKGDRAAIKGAPDARNLLYAMCTSCPEVRRWMRDSLEHVFREVPGLGGIFTITASENHTSCACRNGQDKCPRCSKRSRAEIIAEVNNTLIEGMARGNPEAEAVVWDWAWPDEIVPEIIQRLTKKNCRFMSISERHIPTCRGGIPSKTGEYSISVVGPGTRATNFWHLAHAAGLKTAAKVQCGATWEFSAIPYLPTMDLVARHAFNLANADVDGVMLSWSLGCCPSPNLTAYRDIKRGAKSPDEFLNALALRLYGEKAVPYARSAWTAFSDGFVEFPFHVSTLYTAPLHMGPANLLYSRPTGWSATMVGIPYDGLRQWRSIYPEQVFVDQIAKVAAGFGEGAKRFDEMVKYADAALSYNARREAGMFRSAYLHFVSVADQCRFVMARERRDQAKDDAARSAANKEMAAIVRRELATAKALLPLVMADSRIGYECSNHYFYIPQDVREKIVNCRALLDELEK